MQFFRKALVAAALVSFCWIPAPAAVDPFSEIPKTLRTFVERNEIAGAVSLIATRERVLHVIAVGKSNLETGRAMQSDDLFWIASMTKPMSAVAAAILADEGRLSFYDPVEKYLPEFRSLWQMAEETPERRVLIKASRPITLFDLLTHTSGMRGYPVTSPHWTLAEMSKIASKEPLRFPPGSRWGYSTAAIDVLGRVVESVSGQPFAEFMRKRIFDVLEMKETTFWLSREQAARFAENYKKNADGKLEPVKIPYLYGGQPTDRSRPPLGGAGIFSTAPDVARFYQMLLGGGEWQGRRVLRPETVTAMTRKQTGALVVRPGLAVGLGFTVVEIPTRMAQNATLGPGTFGHGGAHGTQSWADPARGVIHVFLIQRAGLPDNSELLVAYRRALAVSLDAAGIPVVLNTTETAIRAAYTFLD